MAAAMQAWMGPQMQQVITQQDFYANQQADILNELAGNFSSPALSNAARAMAAQVPLNTSQQALATLNQIALTPGMYGFSADGTAVSGPFADPNAVGSAQPMLDPLVALLAGQTAGQAAAQ